MRISIDIPDELHRRVRVKAAEEGTTVSAVVRSQLTNWAIGSWQEAREYHPKEPGVQMHPDPVITGPPLPPAKAHWAISKADQAKGKSRK